MRFAGIVLIAVGILYGVIAFNMDVSVGYRNIANLDAMETRQNHLMVACVITLIGVILYVFGNSSSKQVD